MSLLYSLGDNKFKYPYRHDPDDARYYHFVWGAPLRLAEKEYLLDEVVIPSAPNGFYYVCVVPGVTGAHEHAFTHNGSGLTVDGGVTWEAIPYDLMLRRGDSFTSTWTSETAGVLIDEAGSDEYRAWVRVYEVPADVESFEIANHVIVTRADSKIEKYDRTLVVKVKEL